mmetsp:Transcript_35303/g.94015  ORF Transcript_35303/g.94015 Transcript_35303/m.94015 type:complete len:1048 (-) Transcript_35303:226-3369(-)
MALGVWMLLAMCAGSSCDSLASSQCEESSMVQVRRLEQQTRSWSSLLGSGTCSSGPCVVPAGETWILDRSMTVDTLTVSGTLRWDTSVDGLELRSGYVVVDATGHLEVGSVSAPMEKSATIYITENAEEHPKCGHRFLCGLNGGRVEIHGRELARTWTLLSRTAHVGSTELFLKDEPASMGWRAGDRIGLATTSRGVSTVHTIEEFGPATEWSLTPSGASAGVEHPEWNEVATNAIDGNERTRWSSWCAPNCGDGAQQWLVVDLVEPCYLTRLSISFSTTRFAPRFDILVRAAGAGPDDWSLAASVTNGVAGWNNVLLGSEAIAVKFFAHFDSMDAAGREPAWAGNGVAEVLLFGRELSAPVPTVVRVREPLSATHWGGVRTFGGRTLEMAAEVINLERSVLITGDSDNFENSMQGIHVLQGYSGVMDVRYARVEHCGQRDIMGRYCLHFHLLGDCPECIFKGNAVVDSMQIGITVHGTHRSVVDENVVFDARAVGIYTEDGNEMNNVISNNVVMCSWWEKCSVTWLNNFNQVAGIFLIGMTNDLIGNRVVGHENGIWTNGAARAHGHGKAAGKVCVMNAPFGVIRGNVNHDCHRFGVYPDNQHPRMLKRDANGYVTDWASCDEFTSDGQDNGVSPANVIEDSFEWHNMFVGAYSLGDVQYRNLVSVNNAHPLYWKTSKNFADGRLHHIVDSVFLNDPSDGVYGQLTLLSAGGPFTFGMKNVTLAGGPTGGGALQVGQHCGRAGAGSPCNTVYLLEEVDFSQVTEGEPWVRFGVNELDEGARVLPVLTSPDNSLDGFRSIVTGHLDGFGELDGCAPAGARWQHGFGCSYDIRRLNVWGADVGNLQLSGPGYSVQANWADPVLGMNSGRMYFSRLHSGYGAPVIAGETYTISRSLPDHIFEFSDPLLATRSGVPEALSLTVGSEACELHASDDRAFLSSSGPAAGVSRKCGSTPPPQSPSPASTAAPSVASSPSPAPPTQSNSTAPDASGFTCSAGDTVQCCPDGSCGAYCAGDEQCCPGTTGSYTCPSSSTDRMRGCTFAKKFDCTR